MFDAKLFLVSCWAFSLAENGSHRISTRIPCAPDRTRIRWPAGSITNPVAGRIIQKQSPKMVLSAGHVNDWHKLPVGRRCAGVNVARRGCQKAQGSATPNKQKRMKLKNLLKKAKGFTLVELIAVVSVILILVAIVVPRIGDLRGQASNARAQSNAKIVQSAIERAAVEGALTSANATDQASVYSVLTTATNGMSGAPYLSEVPNPTPTISGSFPNFTVTP
jgi:prepilin-type N-terminal cleavage/methylation domain-containing protein